MAQQFFEELSRCLRKEQIESYNKEDRRLEIFLHGQPVLSVSPGNEVFLLPAGSKNPEANELYAHASKEVVRKEALQLHVARLFDNPLWVHFVPFNRQYRPEVLETAHLVTVVNECCNTPGEVTQEQVDQSANGMIACPCCGRWSPFHCVEQAENEENKLGMEMIPQ